MKGLIFLTACVAVLATALALWPNEAEPKAHPGNTLNYRVGKLERQVAWLETMMDAVQAGHNGEALCFAGWVNIQPDGEPLYVELVEPGCVEAEIEPPTEKQGQPAPDPVP